MPDVELAHHFGDGVKVGVWPRTGDFFPGPDVAGSPSRTVTMRGDGASLKGLEAGRYWAARLDGVRGHFGFTAKDVPARPRQVAAAPNPQATPRAWPHDVEIVTGPRGTKVGGRFVETPLGKGQEATPYLNQASVDAKTPQRSATLLGQATPVDPDEPQPKPRQEDVKKGTKQRSDLETGEATPISDDAGPTRQEDYRGWQRSDTETGEATPIGFAEPRGTSVNPSAEEQAEGVRSTQGGDKPERSGKSDEKGPNPEVAAEGRKTPRRQSRSSLSRKRS